MEIDFGENDISVVEPNAFEGMNSNTSSKNLNHSDLFLLFLLIFILFSGLMNSKILLNSNRIETLDAEWLQPILANANQVDVRGKKGLFVMK